MALCYKSPTSQPTLRVVMRPPFCTEYTSPSSPLKKKQKQKCHRKRRGNDGTSTLTHTS